MSFYYRQQTPHVLDGTNPLTRGLLIAWVPAVDGGPDGTTGLRDPASGLLVEYNGTDRFVAGSSGGYGYAFSANGSDYVEIIGTVPTLGEITVAAGICDITSQTSAQYLSSDGTTGSNGQYILAYGRTDKRFSFWNSGGVVGPDNNTDILTSANPTHILAIRRGSTSSWTADFYLNGEADGLAKSVGGNPGVHGNAVVGKLGITNFGPTYLTMNYFFLWTRPLDPTEVKIFTANPMAVFWRPAISPAIVSGAASGLSIPIAMHYYKRMMGAA